MTTRIFRMFRVFSQGPAIQSTANEARACIIESLESRQLLSASVHAPLVRHERIERPEVHQPLQHDSSTRSSDKSADKSTDKGSDKNDKSPDSSSDKSTDSPDKSTDSGRDA